MSFLGEIKRRKVFQVAAVYAVVAWLIIQIVDVVSEPLSLPIWFDTVAILLLAIGFPIAVILAWAFDLTPEGVVRDQGGVVQRTGRRIEYVLIGLLVVAIGWIGFREFNPPASSADVLPNSIAVLPCDDFSPNPENAYFAPGIHEEILNQLGKVGDLNVIARTSVLQYAGAARPITEIAQELNVGDVMTCSVSYAEGRVSIGAQLTDAETGVSVWSDRYNEEFVNVFDIQADIAINIATALEAELLPSERESIESPDTDSPEAYALYLRALDAGAFSVQGSESYLNQAIDLDPNYAVALATKAFFVAQTLGVRVRDANDSSLAIQLESVVRETAAKALMLDPSLGLAHAALAELYLDYWREEEAKAEFESALELSPDDPMVLAEYAWFNALAGHYEEAIALARRAAFLNPMSPGLTLVLSEVYMFSGELGTATAIAQERVSRYPADASGYFHLAEREALGGNDDAALENLLKWEELGYGLASGERARGAQIYSRLGRKEDAERLFTQVQQLPTSDVQNALAFLAIGDYVESLRLLRAAANSEYPEPGDTLTILVKLNIWDDDVLERPEFVEVRSNLGFRSN